MLFKQSESTAVRRRFPLFLVDATDMKTPETGESGGQPQISKAGGAWANTSATLTSIGNGAYFVELTAAELDTLGVVAVRYKSANTIEFNRTGQVVANDPYDIATGATQSTHTSLLGGLLNSMDTLVDPAAEVSAVPAASSNLIQRVGWLFALARNKITQGAVTQTLRNDGDSANIGTASHSDDGSTYTRGKWN